MLLKNVLVAVDASENSDRALDFALDLTEKFGADLTILNVSESLPMTAVQPDLNASSGANIPVIPRDFMKIHEEILFKAVARAKSAKPHLTVSSVLREGDPAVEIVNCAKEGGFDIVVVGHKGIGKMKEFFVGSISEKVAHLVSCPVVIVK